MVILRATRKLHESLPPGPDPGQSDTALGDWYMNRLVVDRRPLLLLVSSRSLLPRLLPARDVRSLPSRLPEVVAARLRRLGIASATIDAEIGAMVPVVVASTVDRSVLGIMVDFGKAVPCHLEPAGWDDGTLPFVEAQLAETPCYAGRSFEETVFPDDRAPALPASRWLASTRLRQTGRQPLSD